MYGCKLFHFKTILAGLVYLSSLRESMLRLTVRQILNKMKSSTFLNQTHIFIILPEFLIKIRSGKTWELIRSGGVKGLYDRSILSGGVSDNGGNVCCITFSVQMIFSVPQRRMKNCPGPNSGEKRHIIYLIEAFYYSKMLQNAAILPVCK